MVRSELGADAVILGSRRTSGGVEVTAALEAPEPAIAAPPVAIAPAPVLAAAAAVPPSSAPAGVLARHGVPPKLAARLEGGPLSALLARHLEFHLLPDAARRPLLLAGPCGAGKSLTCAKILWAGG